MAPSSVASSMHTVSVPPLPPLGPLARSTDGRASSSRGQRMLAAAATELGMTARDGIRTDGSRRAGPLTARQPSRPGLSLDLDGPRRNGLNALASKDDSCSWRSGDIMASGPQTLVVAAARGSRKGAHTGVSLAKLGPEQREEHELRMICEQIGLKAAQKFSTVREAFRFLDADHDGHISRSEMQYFFRAYNFSNQIADRFFDWLDRDGSGEVEYSEFMKFVAPFVQPENVGTCVVSRECSSGASTRTPSPLGCRSQPSPDIDDKVDPEFQSMLEFIGQKANEKFYNAREAFRYVDSNGDGSISRGEMKWFCRAFNISEEMADKFFGYMDSEASGEVDYQKFVQVLGPFLSLPGTTAAMLQRPEGPRSGRGRASRRSSFTASENGGSFSRDSRAPSLSDASEFACTFPTNILGRAPTPAETEKEMRQVMKDIGEKLPLKFRHVRDAFRPLDLSHNGKITRTEMRSFLRGFGWSHEVADRFFSALDEDCCGEIDFNDFMSHFDSVLGPANRPASRADLIAVEDIKLRQEVNKIASILGEKLLTKFGSARAALTTLDLSNDGRITLSDMRLFFRTMCMPVDGANKMFKCLCKDGSETVEYDGFLALFGPVERPGGRWRTVQELKGTPRTVL